MRSTTVRVSGPVNLRLLRWPGREPGFVLVHGLASNALLWQGVAQSLTDSGYAVTAVDLRGHGESDVPSSGYDTATSARDVAAVIDALGLDRPVVAGQSWGGNVVVELAAAHPDSISGVALIDGGWISLADTFPSWEAVLEQLTPPNLIGRPLADFSAMMRLSHPDWADWAIEASTANLHALPDGTVRARLPLEHHLSILRSIWDVSILDRYPAITVPTLLVPAALRHSQKFAAVQAAAVALADSQVRWYAEADHDVHAQHPVDVARDLVALAVRAGHLIT